MQQGFNQTVNHRALPKAIILKQLAQWLGRQAAKKTTSEQNKPADTLH